MSRMKLFCLPYAGASASIYEKWRKRLIPEITLVPIELAGRGKRFGNPFYEDMTQALEDIIGQMKKELTVPYAIFGHSMGSLLAYELYYAVCDNGLPLPEIIFFSGRSAPHVPRKKENIHLLSDDKFAEEITSYGAVPDGFFEDKELTDLFVPILRNDFRMVERYRYSEKNEKLNCDVAVLYGDSDDTMTGEITEWRTLSGSGCEIVPFAGGHFFIHEQEEQVVQYIKDRLRSESY